MLTTKELALVTLFLLSWHQILGQQYRILKKKKKYSRRWWVRPVNRLKDTKGFYVNLVKELKETDHEEFFSLFRMWPQHFDTLVDLIQPYLVKRSIRTPLPTELRLAVTLMYLAQGDSARSKHLEYRLGKSTVHKIINETCKALWFALNPIVLEVKNRFDWEQISEEFMEKWQFPNCVGAIDGRHMRIQAPPNSGSLFYNYKQFFSVVLLATCDANYKFTWVDVGQYGSISDGGVWANTDFAQDLNNGTVDLPSPKALPGEEIPFPYVFVEDEAFPLTTSLMRPYSSKTRGGLTNNPASKMLAACRQYASRLNQGYAADFKQLCPH